MELAELIIVLLAVICLFGSLGCVALCLKIYTEMMKEHTIRKRYETQGKQKEEALLHEALSEPGSVLAKRDQKKE